MSLQEDAHSLGVAAATMGALTPAWLAAGKPAGALVSAILSAAPRMTPKRRLDLLSGLLQALPEAGARLAMLRAYSPALKACDAAFHMGKPIPQASSEIASWCRKHSAKAIMHSSNSLRLHGCRLRV